SAYQRWLDRCSPRRSWASGSIDDRRSKGRRLSCPVPEAWRRLPVRRGGVGRWRRSLPLAPGGSASGRPAVGLPPGGGYVPAGVTSRRELRPGGSAEARGQPGSEVQIVLPFQDPGHQVLAERDRELEAPSAPATIQEQVLVPGRFAEQRHEVRRIVVAGL